MTKRNIKSAYHNRTLIIGGTGSLGRKLIERLLPTRNVAVYSRDEAKHWTIKNEYASDKNSSGLTFFVGDVRDKQRLRDVIRQYQPKTIIIAAALKQVDTCELSPVESVKTNLLGTQNVIDVVNEETAVSNLSEVLFVSTDKACAPVNVYGMCKSLSERVVTSQAKTGRSDVRFMAVRYGNVLESRGSIIPLFKFQSENCPELTVTDPEMTRFVMTLDDSVSLILKALESGSSGETWIPQLPAMRIGDLAELFSERSGKPIKITGLRPGEKMHEDLINSSEAPRVRAVSYHDGSGQFHVIQPAYTQGNGEQFTYSSDKSVMPKQELHKYLTTLGIIDWPLEKFQGRRIEEIEGK